MSAPKLNICIGYPNPVIKLHKLRVSIHLDPGIRHTSIQHTSCLFFVNNRDNKRGINAQKIKAFQNHYMPILTLSSGNSTKD